MAINVTGLMTHLNSHLYLKALSDYFLVGLSALGIVYLLRWSCTK